MNRFRQSAAVIALVVACCPFSCAWADDPVPTDRVVVTGTRILGPEFDVVGRYQQFGLAAAIRGVQSRLTGPLQHTPPNPGQEGNPGPCDKGEASNPETGHPVVLASGKKVLEDVDFSIVGEQPFEFLRSYDQQNASKGIFGYKWSSPFDLHLSFYFGAIYCAYEPGGSG